VTGKPRTYVNPILDRGCADPFILSADDGYYLYCTGKGEDGRFLPVYHSPDLAAWQFVRGAVERGPEGAWNRRNFWAPEVIGLDGRCWLYYTAMPDGTPGNTGNRVGLAVADEPHGPFEDRGVVVPYASLDGSPFVDADGTLYLYHTAEFGSDAAGLVPGRIYGIRLAAPDRVAGEPVELVAHHPWQEGPCLMRRDGRYYLFYSVGSWADATYCVRYALGDSPLGPFDEAPEPVLRSTEHVIGPGHHNVFRGPDGADWLVYHGWDPAHTDRYPRIDRLSWREGRPWSDGPTTTPQPLPGGATVKEGPS